MTNNHQNHQIKLKNNNNYNHSPISSMNTIAGEFSLARRNTSLTIRGPSPRYFCTNSLPTIVMNAAVVAFATALAI